MNRNDIISALQDLRAKEYSRVAFDAHKPFKVGLVYPNTYFVGMSNLGMQIIYEELNERPSSVAERYFLPNLKGLKYYDKFRLPLMSVETQRPLNECQLVGIDITFEMDYFNIPILLKLGRIPVQRKHRIEKDPIVIGGGPCATFNPEPVSDFFDAFLVGEGEGLISRMAAVVEEGRATSAPRLEILARLHELDGVYVPHFYEPLFNKENQFIGYQYTGTQVEASEGDIELLASETIISQVEKSIDCQEEEPLPAQTEGTIGAEADTARESENHLDGKVVNSNAVSSSMDSNMKMVKRHWQPLERLGETVVATDYTEFGAMYIVEVARGCGRHCRFCMAGYCYRTPRVRQLELLKAGVDRAAELGKKVGLMGAAISDYPEIDELVTYIRSKGLRYSCASLRADSLTQDVVDGLAASGQQTITLAPEAGSERLRRVINKGISDEALMQAVTLAAKGGIPHIRLYIMIGLPTETDEDIEAIINMAETIYAHMVEVGCKGRLTLSLNPFIPKPFTPFQWMPMADQKEVSKKLNHIKKSLQKNRRIEVLVESPKEAYVQGVLARGDRRLGAVLVAAVEAGGAQGAAKQFKQACKELGYPFEEELYRERQLDEVLPWSMLDMNLKADYLAKEWEQSLNEAYTAPCMPHCKRCGVCE